MNQAMIESMKAALQVVRQREEQCRDVALSIQRLLEAEGAMYPECGVAVPADALQPELEAAAPARAAGKTAKGAKAAKSKKAAFKAEKAARQEKAAKMARVCPFCGDQYLAKRKDQTNCLADACRKAAADAWKAKAAKEPKAPRTVALDKPAAAGQPTRLERIKALAGGGPAIPESVRAAAAEARESGEVA